MIYVLRMDHTVPDYELWKRDAFDRDPIGRAANGVRRYRVLRDEADGNQVAIELEFDSRAEAEAFAGELRRMWAGARHRFGWHELPRTQLLELAATGEYA